MKQRLVLSLAVVLLFAGVCFAAPVKVAIVTSPNDVHDGGFNEDNYNDLKRRGFQLEF